MEAGPRRKLGLSRSDPETGSGRLPDTSYGPWPWQGPSILRVLTCSNIRLMSWIFDPRKMCVISCVNAQGLKDPHELMSTRGESPQHSPAAAWGHLQKCSPVASVMKTEVATGSPHFMSPSIFSGNTKTADIAQSSPEMQMTPWRLSTCKRPAVQWSTVPEGTPAGCPAHSGHCGE